MCSLPAISGKTAIAAFSKAGFVVKRVTASHHIVKKDGHRVLLSIPVHGNKALKPGTLRALIRDAGLTVAEFVELL